MKNVGNYAFGYHHHDQRKEIFYVVSGTGKLPHVSAMVGAPKYAPGRQYQRLATIRRGALWGIRSDKI